MDLYHIALFLHIVALLVASGVTAITKLAATRRARAKTLGEAREWHGVLMSAAKLFPWMLVVFVATGSFMMSKTQVRVSSTGFVAAGFVGVVLLLASGTYLGLKGKGLAQALDGMIAARGADASVPPMVPPTLVAMLPVANTFLALSVAFDMVTKPQSIATALGIVAIGIALGCAAGLRKPAPAAARASA